MKLSCLPATAKMLPPCFWGVARRIYSGIVSILLGVELDRVRFSLDLRDIRHKVHLVGFCDGLFVVKLGAQIQNGEQHQREVVGYKGVSCPVSFEENGPSAKLEFIEMRTSESQAEREHTKEMSRHATIEYHAA